MGNSPPGCPSVKLIFTSHQNIVDTSDQLTYCSPEGGKCQVEKGCSWVYYGAHQSWHRKAKKCAKSSGCDVSCRNANLCDPISGTRKKCYGMRICICYKSLIMLSADSGPYHVPHWWLRQPAGRKPAGACLFGAFQQSVCQQRDRRHAVHRLAAVVVGAGERCVFDPAPLCQEGAAGPTRGPGAKGEGRGRRRRVAVMYSIADDCPKKFLCM